MVEEQMNDVTAAALHRVHQLESELNALRDLVAEQRKMLDQLLAQSGPTMPAEGTSAEYGRAALSASSADDASRGPHWTRRGLLFGGLTAAAGAAAGVAGASPAAAATGTMQFGAANNATSSATGLTSTSATETLLVTNTGTGQALEVVAPGTVTFSARATTDGAAIRGDANNGVGVIARSSKGATARLEGSGREEVPKFGTWVAGDLVTVTPGPPGKVEIWLCVEGGTPGSWRLVGSPESAGAYVPIVPVRVYDSRWIGVPGLVTGILTPGTVRTIPVANGRSATGVVTQSNAVPPGASAVTMNITVDKTVGRGNIAIVPGDVVTSATSSINWSTTGTVVANGITVRLNSVDRTVNALGRSNNADLIVDITGYYAAR